MRLRKLALIALSAITALTLTACGDNQDAANGGKSSGKYVDIIKDRKKLVAGVKNDTNLFGFKDPQDQQVKGFEVDLVKEFAKRLLGDSNAVELKEVTSKTREKMLTSGEIDLIAATMTITPQRKQKVDFSRVYFMAGQALLVKKDSSIKGPKDLNGKVVATAKGAVSGKNLKATNPNAKIEEYANYAEAFTALRSGRADAVTTDDAILMGMAAQDDAYHVVGERFSEEPYGIAVDKKHKDLLDEVNKFLDEIIKDGTYDALYKKWFQKDPPKDLPKEAELKLQPGVTN